MLSLQLAREEKSALRKFNQLYRYSVYTLQPRPRSIPYCRDYFTHNYRPDRLSPISELHVSCSFVNDTKCYSSLASRQKSSKPSTLNTVSTPKSLEEEYNSVLTRLIESHLPVIQNALNRAEDSGINDQSETSTDLLDSLMDEDYEVSNTIRRLARLQNVHYRQVKTLRAQFKRYLTPVSDYHLFLKYLYPTTNTIRHKKLYEAYQTLPTPRPLHISPQHLEDLISAFMESRKPTHRAVYNTLIDEIIDCGMPISVHEYNASMFMAISSYFEETRDNKSGSLAMEQIERFQNGIAQTRHRDTSTMNILLGFALNSDKEQDFVSQTMRDIQATNIQLDRLSMMIYLMNEGKNGNSDSVRNIYQEMLSAGYLIDISVINTLMKALLACGDFEGCQNIFSSITGKDNKEVPRLSSQLGYISPQSVLVKKAKLVDATVHILKENGISVDQAALRVPIVPDEYTFGTMLSHYCLKDGDFRKALEVLNSMERFGIQPTYQHFNKFYEGFIINARAKATWSRASLNQITSIVCSHYDLLLSQSKPQHALVHTIFKKNLLKKAFKAYHTVFWDFRQPLSELQDEVNQSLQNKTPLKTNNEPSSSLNEPPTTQTVYRALTKLLSIGQA